MEVSNSQSDSSEPVEESNHPNETSTPTETGSKSLVVYFSWSGNTENVAKSIQTQTGADIFEIVPATPYSDDYDTVVDLAREEQRNSARPAISDSIENIEQYDVIYVGFPNWWGDMPMILYSFFDEYDFSGKTIVAFATNGGWEGSTLDDIESAAAGATAGPSLAIQFDSTGGSRQITPQQQVDNWIERVQTL